LPDQQQPFPEPYLNVQVENAVVDRILELFNATKLTSRQAKLLLDRVRVLIELGGAGRVEDDTLKAAGRFRDPELQFANLSFDPPLYSKRATRFKVLAINERGHQLLGITLRIPKKGWPEVKIPDVLNYRDSQRTTMPLSQLSKETLRERILERVRNRFSHEGG
jgi:hypothetical protein